MPRRENKNKREQKNKTIVIVSDKKTFIVRARLIVTDGQQPIIRENSSALPFAIFYMALNTKHFANKQKIFAKYMFYDCFESSFLRFEWIS